MSVLIFQKRTHDGYKLTIPMPSEVVETGQGWIPGDLTPEILRLAVGETFALACGDTWERIA